ARGPLSSGRARIDAEIDARRRAVVRDAGRLDVGIETERIAQILPEQVRSVRASRPPDVLLIPPERVVVDAHVRSNERSIGTGSGEMMKLGPRGAPFTFR